MKDIPEKIGKGFAKVQNFIDLAVETGFKKLNQVNIDNENKKEESNKNVNKAVKLGKNTLKTIGRIGISYYEEYEKLKSKKDSNKK